MRRVLNPSYWLIAYLAARLSDSYNVYTITSSFDPVAKVKLYKGEQIDVIVSIGASYNPATLKAEFKKGFPMHNRAFEIGHITKSIHEKYNPLHVNLCVDVRPWFDSLTETFGKQPDVIITEQEMQWQQVGYLLNNSLYQSTKHIKQDIFFFSGGVKSRQKRFLELTRNLRLTKIIHGGGWDKYLAPADYYKTEGFQQWIDSVQYMLKAKWGCVLHEPLGNEAGWITAKYFEHLGSRTIGFIDSNYDKGNLYIPSKSIFRVESSADIQDKINTLGYDKLIKEQNKLIKPEWSDLEGFYLTPFLKKFAEVIK